MKNLILACLLFVGCAPSVEIHMEMTDEWAVQALESSLNFWESHGISFIETDEGTPIRMAQPKDLLPDDKWGAYIFFPWEEIIVSPKVADAFETWQAQTIAHELGHKLGMSHVNHERSLMGENLELCDGICWSEADQEEFDRVLLNRE